MGNPSIAEKCSKLGPAYIRKFALLKISLRLTNRFAALRLFSNRLQMMSKYSNNKKVTHEAIAESVTDVLTAFDVFSGLLRDRRTAKWNLFVLLLLFFFLIILLKLSMRPIL